MRRQRWIAGASAAAAMTAATAVLSPVPAHAAAALPTLTVTVTAKGITTSGGNTVRAGRTIINVVAQGGEHDLELLKLAKGYSFATATKDFRGLFGGNVATVKRVDKNITFYGGGAATPGKSAQFAETLYPGSYELVDTNGSAHSTLRVVGAPPSRGWVPQTSTIIGNQQDRFVLPTSIPHTGWTLFRDTSDEPHFIVLQQVKPGTTTKAIAAFLASGSSAQPPFALAGAASSGIISGGIQMLWHYSLPKGTYAILCFWPSDENGMPHANMGMYKLVTLA